MTGIVRRLALTAALLLSAPAHAQVLVSDDVRATALTIYPDDLALVTETRVVNLPAGRHTLRFDGVSDLIIPQSLILQSFEGVTLERNFDYDLLGRTSLWEGSVGDTVRLTRIDPDSGDVVTDTAEVLSADASSGVVVRTDAGIEGLFCSGLATQASFGGLPPGLAARPAMTVEFEAEEAGPREVVISYLTSGLGWEADYRLDLGEEINLLGWLSLNNRTAKRYKDVALSVIAGEVQRRPETRGVEVGPEYLRTACWPRGSTKAGVSGVEYAGPVPPPPPPPPPAMVMMESAMQDEVIVTGSRVSRRKAVQEDVGDYKLYRIPAPVTVAAYQTKQVAFLDESGVEAPIRFQLDLDALGDNPRPLSRVFALDNSREGALGVPLPEGTARVFARGEARTVFVGADGVDDTPVGEDLEIELGESVTVFAQAEHKGGPDDVRFTVRVSNAGSAPATVETEDLYYTRTRIGGAERDRDAAVPTWRVEVPAGGEVELDVWRRR